MYYSNKKLSYHRQPTRTRCSSTRSVPQWPPSVRWSLVMATSILRIQFPISYSLKPPLYLVTRCFVVNRCCIFQDIGLEKVSDSCNDLRDSSRSSKTRGSKENIKYSDNVPAHWARDNVRLLEQAVSRRSFHRSFGQRTTHRLITGSGVSPNSECSSLGCTTLINWNSVCSNCGVTSERTKHHWQCNWGVAQACSCVRAGEWRTLRA